MKCPIRFHILFLFFVLGKGVMATEENEVPSVPERKRLLAKVDDSSTIRNAEVSKGGFLRGKATDSHFFHRDDEEIETFFSRYLISEASIDLPLPPVVDCRPGTADCDDGDICNGIETCDPVLGCQPGIPLDCDDGNPCTTETCDPMQGCQYQQVTCEEDESCDPLDGQCVSMDGLRPCVAVIDESDNFSDATMNARWIGFRNNWPDRHFCLLQPQIPSTWNNRLFIPPSFTADNRTIFTIVNRDGGDPNAASDWYDICRLDRFAATSIEFVGLFIDTSGSMTLATVKASYELFQNRLARAGLTYCSVFNAREDWITPFDTTLGSIGGGGDCVRN